jgi:hypothetical protein
MSVLVIVGIILAFLNPVIGGVLVGYIVWLNDPTTGIKLMVLSFFMFSLYIVGYIVWMNRKIKKLEKALKSIEGKA